MARNLELMTAEAYQGDYFKEVDQLYEKHSKISEEAMLAFGADIRGEGVIFRRMFLVRQRN